MIYKLMSFTNKLVYKHASKVIALGEEMKTYMLDNKFTTVEEKLWLYPIGMMELRSNKSVLILR